MEEFFNFRSVKRKAKVIVKFLFPRLHSVYFCTKQHLNCSPVIFVNPQKFTMRRNTIKLRKQKNSYRIQRIQKLKRTSNGKTMMRNISPQDITRIIFSDIPNWKKFLKIYPRFWKYTENQIYVILIHQLLFQTKTEML